MPALSTARMTAKQFLALGEDPPGVRLELVDGEIEMSPSPMPRHSHAIMELVFLIKAYLVETGQAGIVLSDTDTVFGDHDVRRPDVLYFSERRRGLVGVEALKGPPDLAIEVISPSNERTDREIKFKLYEQGGVAHYWIVDPMTEMLEAFRLVEGYYQKCADGHGEGVVSAPPFEGLEISLGRLWLK
ncbi:MAG: Uma2 family endonuclease [Planctomycetota bacterium]